MKKNMTGQPSRLSGILSGVVGIVFVIVGLFIVIPNFGLFGLPWILVAIAITANNFYHVFSKKYVGQETPVEYQKYEAAAPEAGAQPEDQPAGAGLELQGQLDQLDRLKEAGLLTDAEYREKRDGILGRQ